MMSVVPPGAAGTTMRICCVGRHSAWAAAMAGMASGSARAARRLMVIV
jgi:hypothetical protein